MEISKCDCCGKWRSKLTICTKCASNICHECTFYTSRTPECLDDDKCLRKRGMLPYYCPHCGDKMTNYTTRWICMRCHIYQVIKPEDIGETIW